MNKPLVSVCIPAYNVGQYIESTIESVLTQTYKNIEMIIVDDGSTDNTKSCVEKAIKNSNAKLYSQENRGASSARNLAYSKSSGSYVKFLDGDDLINAEMIENQVNLAAENDNCIISGKWGRFYNNDINTFQLNIEECWQTMAGNNWLCTSWKNGKSMTQPGIFLIPKTILEKAGPWDEKLSLIDDLDFFTRAILNCNKVVFEERAILYYRSGISGSLSAITSDEAIYSAFRSIDQATTNLLKADSSKDALKACANVWQNFIYNFYPRCPSYIKMAAKRVKELNGSDLPFACGGLTKIMVFALGWKFAKKIKLSLNV